MATEPPYGEETFMAATDTKPATPATSNPLIVDLGKKRRRDVKRLRNGKGKLFDRVTTTLQELKTAGTISGSAEPVVVIVREKPRKRKSSLLPRC
jgi:hypothetical protein